MTASGQLGGHCKVQLSINSVADLINLLIERYSTDNKILWYRGQRVSSWDVSAGIWREWTSDLDGQISAKERNFTNRFRARASMRHASVPSYREYGPWLSLMQHYGLPTRLLDWSRSPLVALYFAVESLIYDAPAPGEPDPGGKFDDAALWILDPQKLNEIEWDQAVTPAVESEMCKSTARPAFSHNGKENNRICAVMSSEQDARMFIQQGCFTIHSNRTPLNHKQESLEYLTKITIPGQSMQRIALEVDVCGLRKGDLFPDLAQLAVEMTSRAVPGVARF